MDNLPYAVRGLLIGDLPTNLWWAVPVPPPLAGPLLFDLADAPSRSFTTASAGPNRPAASWPRRPGSRQFQSGPDHGMWRVASDLNWRRLKYWRRLLAQALDPASAPDALDSVTEILVEHGPHAVIQAWELVSWLASRLHWQSGGRQDRAGRRDRPGKSPPRMAAWPSACIAWRTAPPRSAGSRIACNLDGKPVALNFQRGRRPPSGRPARRSPGRPAHGDDSAPIPARADRPAAFRP